MIIDWFGSICYDIKLIHGIRTGKRVFNIKNFQNNIVFYMLIYLMEISDKFQNDGRREKL